MRISDWSSDVCSSDLFPPSIYRTLKAWGRGEDEICVLCHHHGKHTGGPYMGIQPTGNELNVVWFSWLKFRDGKIDHIYSISDVRSEEHTSELQSLMRISYAVFCLKKTNTTPYNTNSVITLTHQSHKPH